MNKKLEEKGSRFPNQTAHYLKPKLRRVM